jgi:hypothetical protein
MLAPWAEMNLVVADEPALQEPLREGLVVAGRIAAKVILGHAVWQTLEGADWEARRLLEWHREKAGTIEAIHDVLKNELAAGVLPAPVSEPMPPGCVWRCSRTM